MFHLQQLPQQGKLRGSRGREVGGITDQEEGMEGKPDLDGSKHSEEMRTNAQVHAGWRAFDSTVFKLSHKNIRKF